MLKSVVAVFFISVPPGGLQEAPHLSTLVDCLETYLSVTYSASRMDSRTVYSSYAVLADIVTSGFAAVEYLISCVSKYTDPTGGEKLKNC
ncbi:MAG: hypothetical protein ACK4SY_08645 [Pyrobaculum sp.]